MLHCLLVKLRLLNHTQYYNAAFIFEFPAVLQSGLLNSFEEVSVQVADCPDLTNKPYLLAAEGES